MAHGMSLPYTQTHTHYHEKVTQRALVLSTNLHQLSKMPQRAESLTWEVCDNQESRRH